MFTFGLAWHPSDQVLAIGGTDGFVQYSIWIPTGRGGLFPVNQGAEGGERYLRGLAWSPDGSMLAVTDKAHITSDHNGGIGIWDVQTRTLLADMRYSDYCNVPCWLPDGQTIVTPSFNGTVYVHASHDLQMMDRLRGHREAAIFD